MYNISYIDASATTCLYKSMETIFSSQTMQLLLVFLACYNLAEALPFLSGEDARKMLDTSIGRTFTNQFTEPINNHFRNCNWKVQLVRLPLGQLGPCQRLARYFHCEKSKVKLTENPFNYRRSPCIFKRQEKFYTKGFLQVFSSCCVCECEMKSIKYNFSRTPAR